jgi:hypothetical protein
MFHNNSPIQTICLSKYEYDKLVIENVELKARLDVVMTQNVTILNMILKHSNVNVKESEEQIQELIECLCNNESDSDSECDDSECDELEYDTDDEDHYRNIIDGTGVFMCTDSECDDSECDDSECDDSECEDSDSDVSICWN